MVDEFFKILPTVDIDIDSSKVTDGDGREDHEHSLDGCPLFVEKAKVLKDETMWEETWTTWRSRAATTIRKNQRTLKVLF